MAQEDSVNDAMFGGALTTTADMRIAEAARMMRDADVAIISVVDDDEELIGVITDRDITIVVADEMDTSRTTVGERMSDSPVSVGQNDDLDAAFERMIEGDVHRAPVTDDGGHVSGVLEQSDAARHGEGRRVADSEGRNPS